MNLESRYDRRQEAIRVAAQLARLEVGDARRHLNDLLAEAHAEEDPLERRKLLDFNARLCTILRERQVGIWLEDS